MQKVNKTGFKVIAKTSSRSIYLSYFLSFAGWRRARSVCSRHRQNVIITLSCSSNSELFMCHVNCLWIVFACTVQFSLWLQISLTAIPLNEKQLRDEKKNKTRGFTVANQSRFVCIFAPDLICWCTFTQTNKQTPIESWIHYILCNIVTVTTIKRKRA